LRDARRIADEQALLDKEREVDARDRSRLAMHRETIAIRRELKRAEAQHL
jgi:hypothetical protein